jgi:O-antigen/teichoic acid export membrane protein
LDLNILNTLKSKFELHSEEKILYRNSSYIFFSNIIKSAIIFLDTILFTRILSIEEFGIFIVLVSLSEIIFQTLNPNLGISVIKYSNEFLNDKDYNSFIAFIKFCVIFTLGSSVLSILIVILLSFVGGIVSHNLLAIPFAFFFYIILKSFSSLDGILNGLAKFFDKFKLISILAVICPALSISINLLIFLIYGKISLTTFIIINSSISFIQTIIYLGTSYYLISRNYTNSIFSSKISILKPRIKEILVFILPTSLSKTIKTINTRIDILLLNFFAGSSAVSIYSLAKKFIVFIPLILDPIDNSIYPQIEKLYSNKQFDVLISFLKKITLKVAVFLLISYIVLYFFLPYFFDIFLEPAYLQSILPFNIILIGLFFNYSFLWIGSIILMLKLTRERLIVDTANLIVSSVFIIILVPAFSYIGSSIALSISYFFSTTILLFITYKKFFVSFKNDLKF